MLTTQERIDVRSTLIALGFRRASFTQDHGDGKYEERFENDSDPADAITIHWAPKRRPVRSDV